MNLPRTPPLSPRAEAALARSGLSLSVQDKHDLSRVMQLRRGLEAKLGTKRFEEIHRALQAARHGNDMSRSGAVWRKEELLYESDFRLLLQLEEEVGD